MNTKMQWHAKPLVFAISVGLAGGVAMKINSHATTCSAANQGTSARDEAWPAVRLRRTASGVARYRP